MVHAQLPTRVPFLAPFTIAMLLAPGTTQQQKLTAEGLFAPDHLVTVSIEIAPKDWEILCGQARDMATSLMKEMPKRPYTWFKGNVTIDGVRIENVGIRKKGFLGSQDDVRPSLKIKFAEFQKQDPVQGLDRLTLNNNKQDAAQTSQVMTYALFRKAGVHAPRCNFAKVTVNGTSLGIYSHVDSIKRAFLKHSFLDDSGMLFEGTVADFFPSWIKKFQRKNKAAKNAALAPLANALAADPVDMKVVTKHLDLDGFLKFWAVESLVSFWDGYSNNQNNFYIYRHPKDEKIRFIPWGADNSFTSRMPLPPYFIKNKSVLHMAVLPNRLYRIPEVRKRYRETLDRLLAEVWQEEELLAETQRIEAIVKDHLHPRQKNFPAAIRKVRSWIKSRRKVLGRELRKWPIDIKTGAREPMYFDPIGEATGTFSTTWHEGNLNNPKFTGGEARVKLKVDGKPVAFKRIAVTSTQSNWPTLDGSPKPPAIMFVGPRASDGEQLVLVITPTRADFRGGLDRPVMAQGAYLVGKMAMLNPKGMMMVGGTVRLSEAGMKPGDKVVGEFSVRIVKMKGGETRRYEGK